MLLYWVESIKLISAGIFCTQESQLKVAYGKKIVIRETPRWSQFISVVSHVFIFSVLFHFLKVSQFEGDALFCYLPIIQETLSTWIASGDETSCGRFIGRIQTIFLLTSDSFAVGSFPEALGLDCL